MYYVNLNGMEELNQSGPPRQGAGPLLIEEIATAGALHWLGDALAKPFGGHGRLPLRPGGRKTLKMLAQSPAPSSFRARTGKGSSRPAGAVDNRGVGAGGLPKVGIPDKDKPNPLRWMEADMNVGKPLCKHLPAQTLAGAACEGVFLRPAWRASLSG